MSHAPGAIDSGELFLHRESRFRKWLIYIGGNGGDAVSGGGTGETAIDSEGVNGNTLNPPGAVTSNPVRAREDQMAFED